MFRSGLQQTARWMWGIVAVMLSISFLAGTSHAAGAYSIYRVALSGADVPGCGTIAQPCQSPSYAVLETVRNSTYTGEIRMAGGTYTQARSGNIILMTVYPSNLRIVGGYSTSDWSISNPTANPTIIDGQNTNRGVLISISGDLAQLCNVTIANMTITNGRGTTNDPSGGGVLIDSCANARLNNVTVQNSISQGANNTNVNANGIGDGTGGGISIRGDATKRATLTLTNVIVKNNQAIGGSEASGARGGLAVGGGVFAINATLRATNLTVMNNTAQAGDAPGKSGEQPQFQFADGIGGGLTAIECLAVEIDGFTATNNIVLGGDAGGVGGYALGGGAAFERTPNVTLQNAKIANNSITGGNGATSGGSEGGGIHTTGTTLTLTNVELLNNTANTGTGAAAGQSYGGGLFMTVSGTTSSLTGSNIIVAANTINGAGITAGGGIGIRSTPFNLAHITFANNLLTGGNELGQAMFLQAAPTAGTLSNSITSGHSGADSFNANDSATATINRLMVNDTTTALTGGSGITTQNLITGNPFFVSPGSPNYNYHIGAGSNAINAAIGSTTTTDLDKQPRPIGAAADLGADEYQIEVTATASNNSISIDWDAPPGATVTSYQVQYTKSNGASNASQGASPIGTGNTNLTMTGLTQGATYTITIVAFNGAVEVTRSRSITLITSRLDIGLPLIAN
jgi:hypothetical protein